MLQTETNTAAMERRVLRAAHAILRCPRLQADFEHGQWWITDLRTGAQWSCVDAEGPGTVNGLDFEQVTEGDEETEGDED
ncbi:MAG: hypothetical protein KJ604_20700 [Gammaproteobacteria bacterium]|nr:hypothetical protein [Gammaproteobacteria bacterium]